MRLLQSPCRVPDMCCSIYKSLNIPKEQSTAVLRRHASFPYATHQGTFARSCDACLSKVAEDGVAACSWYWRWFCLQNCCGICRLVGTQCSHLYVVKAQVEDVKFAFEEVFLYLLLVSNSRRSITKLFICINEEGTLLSPRLPTNFRTGWSPFASSPPTPHPTPTVTVSSPL